MVSGKDFSSYDDGVTNLMADMIFVLNCGFVMGSPCPQPRYRAAAPIRIPIRHWVAMTRTRPAIRRGPDIPTEELRTGLKLIASDGGRRRRIRTTVRKRQRHPRPTRNECVVK